MNTPKNVWTLNTKTQEGARQPETLGQLLQMQVVLKVSLSRYQQALECNSAVKYDYNCYITSSREWMTGDDFMQYASQHSEDNFLLIKDSEATPSDIYAWLDYSVTDCLIVYLFHLRDVNGKMQLVAKLKTKPDTLNYEPVEMLFDDSTNICLSSSSSSIGFSYRINQQVGDVNLFHVVNASVPQRDQWAMRAEDIRQVFLKLQCSPRFATVVQYRVNFYWEINGSADVATLPAVQRWGLSKEKFQTSSYLDRPNTWDEIFEGPALDTDTYKRVCQMIERSLAAPYSQLSHLCNYYNDQTIYQKSFMVITEPLPGHRRPTYHILCGAKAPSGSETVELARGELQGIDLSPATVFFLGTDGKYHQLDGRWLGSFRDWIKTYADFDPITLAQWGQDKSYYPNLIRALVDSPLLPQITTGNLRYFNRIHFGALFAEQLLKSGYEQLALSFVTYVARFGDTMDNGCGSLEDIFPGANPEGTTIPQMLNLTKPALALLLAENSTDIQQVRARYTVIKALAPDGIMTKTRLRRIEQYYALSPWGLTRFYGSGDSTISVLSYPDEIPSIYKMITRLTKILDNMINPDRYTFRRHYEEIVKAYFLLKSVGIDPKENCVFLEFSTDVDNVEAMLISREQVANKALQNYRDKMNAVVRQRGEASFANRSKAMQRLTKPEGDFAHNPEYIVVAPSQIYGQDVVDSIEHEGAHMHHCVFRSYAHDIAYGRYTVLYLRKKSNPTEPLVTIGITSAGRINQTYGKNDYSIQPAEANAIAEWAASKKGLVTFQSEKANVCPGGWNYAYSVPALPLPSGSWLKQLADTTQKTTEEKVNEKVEDID